MSLWLVICRAMHFAAALLAFGVFAFEALVVEPCDRRMAGGIGAAWRPIARRLGAVAFALLFLSGLGWFLFAAADMTGTPITALWIDGKAQLVWRATHFGFVWMVRLALCLGAAVFSMAALAMPLQRVAGRWLSRLAALLTGLLLASLAWVSHAGASGPLTIRVAIDALHLLIAGLWPAGLLPLACLLLHLRRAAAASAPAVGFLVARFSNLALLGAGLLLASGTGQICFLANFTHLLAIPYGRLLAAKIALFGLLVALGAANRLRLVPRILKDAADPAATRRSITALLQTLAIELLLTAGVIGIVALLGLLPPGVPP